MAISLGILTQHFQTNPSSNRRPKNPKTKWSDFWSWVPTSSFRNHRLETTSNTKAPEYQWPMAQKCRLHDLLWQRQMALSENEFVWQWVPPSPMYNYTCIYIYIYIHIYIYNYIYIYVCHITILSLSPLNDHLGQMNVKCAFKTTLANFLARLNAWARGSPREWKHGQFLLAALFMAFSQFCRYL